jgi:transposase
MGIRGRHPSIEADTIVAVARLELEKRACGRDGQFEVLPRRWVVERTFGWMIRWRSDYERRIDISPP